MKKYIKITGSLAYQTDQITSADLVRLKQRGYDLIIDVKEGTYFDADNNEWKQIER